MSSRVKFSLHIEAGKILNQTEFNSVVSGLKDGEHLAEVFIGLKRSLPQNRFYYGIVVPMVRDGLRDLGHDVDLTETHEFLKSRFNVEQIINQDTGETISLPKSTTRLSTFEFSNYVAAIQQFAAEWLNIIIPDPGTQLKIY